MSVTELTFSTKPGSPTVPGSLKGTSIYLGQLLKPETENLILLSPLSPQYAISKFCREHHPLINHESVKFVHLCSLLIAIILLGTSGSGLCYCSGYSNATYFSRFASLQARPSLDTVASMPTPKSHFLLVA